MKEILKQLRFQSLFIILAIVIGGFLNQSHCVPDPFCDPDPLYGGCSSSCEFGTLDQWALKSFGVLVLLNAGFVLGKEKLKEKDNLEEFILRNDLQPKIHEIDRKWTDEENKNNKRLVKLMESLEAKKIK